MTNIATAFRSEISRLSRKEIRVHTEPLAKASRTHRSEIAALERRIQALEALVKRLSIDARKSGSTTAESADAASAVIRFSAKGLASHRQRLGLTAAELGKLLGASAQTVYNWEKGASRPTGSALMTIGELRRMGKRGGVSRLAEMQS